MHPKNLETRRSIFVWEKSCGFLKEILHEWEASRWALIWEKPTCKWLEAVQIKCVCLQELNACAATDRWELWGDGMHRMPETCQPQAIVSVQPTVCPIILQIERELALFNSREKLDKTRLPNEWIQRNRDTTINSSFRRIATTDQTLRSSNLSTRLNIRANKTCIYLERTLRNHLHRKKLLPLLLNFHLKDFYNKQRRRWKKNKREDERQKENFLFGFFITL